MFYLTVLFLNFVNPAYASEQDSFQAQLAQLSDSTNQVNLLVNKQINRAIEQTNKLKGCSKKRLYHYLKYYLASANIVGINDVEDQLNRNSEIEKYDKPFSQSVFKNLSFFESIALNTYGLGPLIRINDIIIGTDKIGHFLSEGNTYYEKAIEKKWDITKALYFGHMTESGLFGFFMTGVYSYADLTANFNGLRFWNRLLSQNPQVMNEDEKLPSYFTCTDSYWEQKNKFNILDYVDHGWDETINCNKYNSNSIEQKITNQISELEKSTQQHLRCPRKIEVCAHLRLKYHFYANDILHPICL